MSHLFSGISQHIRRRWFYGLMSTVIAFGIVVGTPRPSQAISWLDLIFRGIQVIQISNISDRQEVELGQRVNRQLVNEEFRLYTNSSITQYVDQIGQRLVPNSDRSNIPYVFQVVDDNAVNAYATMGGYVYVTTGLLKTADNEAQLASVLGHEIGHIAARHAIDQMREQAIAQGVASAAGLDRNVAVAIGVDLAVRRPNSRRDELEADQLGLRNIIRTGYAPNAMVAFMQKLVGQASSPSILRTHPAPQDRIVALQQSINSATGDTGSGMDSAAYRERIRPLL